MEHQNLLTGPAPAELADNPDARTSLDAGINPYEVAARFPGYIAAWADLADRAFGKGEVIESYAFARTGYHRGLDQLRRVGWKGHGPIPWEHRPNRGFLRALHALARAAAAIGENDEAERCRTFLRACSPTAAKVLET